MLIFHIIYQVIIGILYIYIISTSGYYRTIIVAY